MNNLHVKTGDNVMIISGKDKMCIRDRVYTTVYITPREGLEEQLKKK